jgi:hypothetical protein
VAGLCEDGDEQSGSVNCCNVVVVDRLLAPQEERASTVKLRMTHKRAEGPP